jgi:hypothetical protein
MLPEIAPWPALAAGGLLAFGGLAALSQAMARHHAQVWGAPPVPGRAAAWRWAGGGLLAAAFVACLLGWGLAAGAVAWFGLLSVTGTALVLVWLPYAPRVLRILAFAVPVLGLATLAGAVVHALVRSAELL